ncbi:MAG: hypothetical protein ACRC1T_03715 [Clostridium chrysemydis]|uniref:hypothetical protein n=1 Tax=Clostridium chrysemydis TaxID=2665504 RepID=UPI003F39A362
MGKFLKENIETIIRIIIFCIGLYIIYNSIIWGREDAVNYISGSNWTDGAQFNVLVDKSILKYMILGVLVALISITKRFKSAK